MGDPYCDDCVEPSRAAFRPFLWLALSINATMFFVEIGTSVVSGSNALQADALDFLGDAANYALSLAVFGLAVGPSAAPMGLVGVIALAANGTVALLLYRFRTGDANMHSVWICARNDVLGNVAVLLAALGVFGTGARWPDSLVALVMASLAISGAWKVRRRAMSELGAVRR